MIGENIIDVQGMIEYFEDMHKDEDDRPLYAKALEELADCGHDVKWNDEWYPAELIEDDYFIQYTMQLVEDTGFINNITAWPYSCIDWECAADALKDDYSSIDIDGFTYWYR